MVTSDVFFFASFLASYSATHVCDAVLMLLSLSVCLLFVFLRRSDGLYMYQGSDTAYIGDGKPSFNIVSNNVINDALEGLKIGDTVGNEFTGNVSRVTFASAFAFFFVLQVMRWCFSAAKC